MDLYNKEENDIIASFEREVKSGRIDPENYDIQSGKAKSRYLAYIDRVAAFKPVEYKTSDFNDIEQNELITISIFIIKEIFGNTPIDDELVEFFQNMTTSGSNEVLNGLTVTYLNPGSEETHYLTEIPSANKTGCIVTIVHEFIHFHCNKKHIDYNKKRYYEEILSIYAEKIAAMIVTAINSEPNFIRMIEETRLEGIVWHYKVHPEELDWIVRTYQQAKKSPNLQDRMFANKLEQNAPWLKSPVAIKNALSYKKNLADSYGIGYLYSESLLRRFLDDKDITEDKIRKVLTGEERLQDVLTYFGINAKSPEVYSAVDEKIQTLRLK